MAKNPLTQKDVTDYLSANNLQFDPQGINTALAKYNGTIGDPSKQYSINDVGAAFGYSPEQSRAWMQGQTQVTAPAPVQAAAKPALTQQDVTAYLAANNLNLDPSGISNALARYNAGIGDPSKQYSINDVGAAFGYSPEQSRAWMNGGTTATQQPAKPQGLLAQQSQTQTQQSAPLSPVQPVSAPQIQVAPFVQPVSAPQIRAAPSAVQAQAQQITVDPTKTSQGLYEQYSAKDSLAKQLAETASMERANSRGLLNSSMAVGEAQKARDVVDLASANADAGIYSNAAQTNAQLGTQVSIANMNDAGSTQRARIQEEGAAARQAQQLTTNAAQTNAQLWTQTSIANMNDAGSTQRARIQEEGAAARQAQQLSSQQQLAELDAQVRKDISRENNAQSMAVAQLNAATQEKINQLDSASREKISQATIEANNLISNRQIDASERSNFQNATTNAMGNYANAISKIDLDTNLDAASKAAAREAAEVVMRNSMTAAAAVAGVEGISQLWAVE